jgi:phosphatidylinositol N-acetylglucosaminyltransferase subunit H
LNKPTVRFIPTTSIQDILIHEAFRGFEVRFYLFIVVKGEEDVVVVFPKLLPRREVLETVWRGARACLYDGATATQGIKEDKGKEYEDGRGARIS